MLVTNKAYEIPGEVLECSKTQKVYLDTATNLWHAIPKKCGNFLCETCGAKKMKKLEEKLLAAIYKNNMQWFLTVTTRGTKQQLNKQIGRLNDRMRKFNFDRYVLDNDKRNKSKNKKSIEEHKSSYDKMLKKEIKKEVRAYFMFIYEVKFKLNGKEVITKNRVDFAIAISKMINKGQTEYKWQDGRNRWHSIKINNLEKWQGRSYTNSIVPKGESYEFYLDNQEIFKKMLDIFLSNLSPNAYDTVLQTVTDQMTMNLDKPFTYFGILEWQKNLENPHYHILTNYYIPLNIYNSISDNDSRIYDLQNLPKEKITDLKDGKDVEIGIIQYIMKYITKETKALANSTTDSFYIKSHNIEMALDSVDDKDKENTYVYKKTFESMPFGNNKIIGTTKEEADIFIDENSGIFFEGYVPNGVLDSNLVMYKTHGKIKRRIAHYLSLVNTLEDAYDVIKQIDLTAFEFSKTIDLSKQENLKGKLALLKEKIHMDYDYKWRVDRNEKASLIVRENMNRIKWNETIKRNKVVDMLDYSPKQKEFFKAFENPKTNFLFLGGSAGTGKTTMVNHLFKKFDLKKYKVVYCSLSGKAVNNIRARAYADGIGDLVEAKTIHTLCEAKFFPIGGYFMKHGMNQLDCQILVIDEIGMLDKFILASLLEATPTNCKIIMLGDSKQLNPINSNNVIEEFKGHDSEWFKTVILDKNYRSEDHVNKIAMNIIDRNFEEVSHLTLNENSMVKACYDAYKKNNSRIICNSNRLVTMMNKHIASYKTQIDFLNIYNYDLGDEIMILKNDKEKELYNGDLLTIISIKKVVDKDGTLTGEKRIVCKHAFDGSIHDFGYEDSVSFFAPAFAITAHKSQGSQYENVVFCADNKPLLLNNNILYTAITRAEKDVEIILLKGKMINGKETKTVTIEDFTESQKNEYDTQIFDITFEEIA